MIDIADNIDNLWRISRCVCCSGTTRLLKFLFLPCSQAQRRVSSSVLFPQSIKILGPVTHQFCALLQI